MKSFVLFLIASLLAVSLYPLQRHLDSSFTTLEFEDLKYLPSGKFLKGAALSHDELLADLLWIKAIGYFGEHAVTDQNYDWLYHILEITTTLDPLFADPYEFGGVVFAAEIGDVDKSIALLEKGMENVPKSHWRYWYLPFFLGFDYMYYKADYQAAARYLEIAASLPGSPSYLPLLVSRLYVEGDSQDIAIIFLEKMVKSTESAVLKEKLLKRIKEVRVDRDICFLEKARDTFVARWNRYPEDLSELVGKDIIQALPQEPFGGEYKISSVTHHIYSSTKAGKLELYQKNNMLLKKKNYQN